MLRAYAKINLGLRVLERRPDGYHNIVTVFHRIALCDEIALTASPTIGVISSSAEVPSDETNICYRAATLLSELLHPRAGVRIELRKRIPVGAGLGGGSSDAATVLLHLPAFWGCSITADDLSRLALHLGSDVPFFLRKGSAIAAGRGERLTYFSADIPYWILVCYPNIHISTAWAYARVTPRSRTPEYDPAEIIRTQMRNPELLRAALVNDFEPVVFEAYPQVRSVKELMLTGGAVFASMSGSGSAVFGFFQEEERARALERVFAAQGFTTHLTPPHFSVERAATLPTET